MYIQQYLYINAPVGKKNKYATCELVRQKHTQTLSVVFLGSARWTNTKIISRYLSPQLVTLFRGITWHNLSLFNWYSTAWTWTSWAKIRWCWFVCSLRQNGFSQWFDAPRIGMILLEMENRGETTEEIAHGCINWRNMKKLHSISSNYSKFNLMVAALLHVAARNGGAIRKTDAY